jgi:hypothetical protein
MGKRGRSLVGCLVVLTLVSCTVPMPWRQRYLAAGRGHLTQDEVSQTLGPPDRIYQRADGGTIWRYRYTGSVISGTESGVVGTSTCAEYILQFCSDRILRQSRRQRC